jgi:hypothetical protein
MWKAPASGVTPRRGGIFVLSLPKSLASIRALVRVLTELSTAVDAEAAILVNSRGGGFGGREERGFWACGICFAHLN